MSTRRKSTRKHSAFNQRICIVHQTVLDDPCWCGQIHGATPVDCCYECPFEGMEIA